MSQVYLAMMLNITFTGIGIGIIIFWLADLTKLIIDQQVTLDVMNTKIDELRGHLGNYEDELAQVRAFYESQPGYTTDEPQTKIEKA